MNDSVTEFQWLRTLSTISVIDASRENVSVITRSRLWIIRRIKWSIASNNHSFDCPIVYTDTIHNAIFFQKHVKNALYNKAHSPIGRPYLAIIASNGIKVNPMLRSNFN